MIRIVPRFVGGTGSFTVSAFNAISWIMVRDLSH
jgi:hypothetical protein